MGYGVWFWTYRRLYGSYLATAFEEVIEANRRGTWTINAETVQVPPRIPLSGKATYQDLAHFGGKE
jgi:hypothetical protein